MLNRGRIDNLEHKTLKIHSANVVFTEGIVSKYFNVLLIFRKNSLPKYVLMFLVLCFETDQPKFFYKRILLLDRRGH